MHGFQDPTSERGSPCMLPIARLWNGAPVPDQRKAEVVLTLQADTLHITFTAPYFGDPTPTQEVGSTPRLWEYEVLEVFLVGAAEQYLELEFGPHGHYLALCLQGVRTVVSSGHPLQYNVRLEREHYHGQAAVPRDLLPAGPLRGNAFLIHGPNQACPNTPVGERCYHAHGPVPGPAPDFHRLNHFPLLLLR